MPEEGDQPADPPFESDAGQAFEFVRGTPFEEAVQKFGERSVVGSILRSANWSQVPTALRERAFFSATVENVRFLDRAQSFLEDSIAGVNNGGRAKFIEDLQQFALREGMGSLDPDVKGTVRDIASETRLGLIFDTNMKAAQDYGYWKQGMDPDVLDAFPAQRFIRVAAVRKPRPRHEANLGAVRRKDDLKFWLYLNDPDIGGFSVPWGPFGFNSGCDVEDVSRKEAVARGLITEDERVVTNQKAALLTETPTPGSGIRRADIDLNANLQASTQGLDQPLKNLLELAFGDRVTFEDDIVRWTPPRE